MTLDEMLRHRVVRRTTERFDAAGTYIRRWVPEYDGPASMKPIVDLKAARVRAIVRDVEWSGNADRPQMYS